MAIKFQIALSDTLRRIYPHTQLKKTAALTLDAARGERISFQFAVRNLDWMPLNVKLSLAGSDGLKLRIRRAGYVPVPHANPWTMETEGPNLLPGYVPDPLFDEDSSQIGPRETQAFWCNVEVPPDLKPKSYTIRAELTSKDKKIAAAKIVVRVHPLVLKERQNFPVLQWFYADALCDYYKVQPFEEKFWQIVEPYMRDQTTHFQDCMYVPVFTPPTDGVKRPTQLLKVRASGGRYTFDWADVKRWVDLARRCGSRYFEWTHFFSQWGAGNAIRIYEKNGDEDRLLWDEKTTATSETYRNFLGQFLPEFKKFLDREQLFERSYFHVSDEPHTDHLPAYKAARAVLRELAPWMKTTDALSAIEFGREGLTDLPIPIIRTAPEFAREGIAHGVYFCCGPLGEFLNRMMDTPLAKIRMAGWLFYRFESKLFLHWGYNYWHRSQKRELIDPFTVSDAGQWPGWAYGDTFCVYPGPNGPIDSIRWEVFAESLQDYALLQSAAEATDGALLRPLKSFEKFPKTQEWVRKARRGLLR
jgi:hypothetical protein